MEEIPEVMSNVHIGIVPKRKDTFGNEAFSTKILEFMAMGIPVIVSNTKIDTYYFSDSEVCFFESGDENSLAEKILLLKNDFELRKKYIEKIKIYHEKIPWRISSLFTNESTRQI